MSGFALACSCQRGFKGLLGKQVLHALPLWYTVQACTRYWTDSTGMWVNFSVATVWKSSFPPFHTKTHQFFPKLAFNSLLNVFPMGFLWEVFSYFLIRKFLCIIFFLLWYVKMDLEIGSVSTGEHWTVNHFLLYPIKKQTKRGYVFSLFYIKYKHWSLKHFLTGWAACKIVISSLIWSLLHLMDRSNVYDEDHLAQYDSSCYCLDCFSCHLQNSPRKWPKL